MPLLLRSILRNTLALLTAAERQRFSFLAVANAIVSIADIASLALLLAVIRFYTEESSSLKAYFFSAGVQHRLWPACIFLGFFLLKNVFAFWLYGLQSRFVYKVASRMSRNQLLQYLKGPYEEYVAVDSARQNHLINHQPTEFAHYVLSGIQQIFTECMLISLAVIAIVAFDARLFLLLLLFLLPAVLLATYFQRKKLKSARANIKSDASMAMQYLQESLGGYVESRVYGKELFFTGRYTRRQDRLNEHLAGLQIAQWIPGRLVEVFAVCGLFLMILINASYGTVVDTISIGAFLAAAYKIIPGIGRIVNHAAQIRIYAYTLDHLMAEERPVKEEVFPPAPTIEKLAFRKVSYAHGETPILHQFDLQLCRGDFVCVVGRSGRGKTTLLNLLLGFLSPAAGDISINGRVLSGLERLGWHGRMAYVKQQPFLLHDTIAKNILLDDEEPDEARLRLAIDQSGLSPFIASFAERENKLISDNGKNISGGQRQRIALARALYRDADLIILDEPFSEMDESSERHLLENLKVLCSSGKIVLLVSHSTRAHGYCSKMVVLDE